MAAQKKANGNGDPVRGPAEGTKKERVAALLNVGGKTYKQIAAEVGCAESYVSIIAGELGMTKKRGPTKVGASAKKASASSGAATGRSDGVVELLRARRVELLEELSRVDEALRVLTRR